MFDSPRSAFIISQGRNGHSAGHALLGSLKLQFMPTSSTSQQPRWLVLLETSGLSQSWQMQNRCQGKYCLQSYIPGPFGRRQRAAETKEASQETEIRFLLFQEETDKGCQIRLNHPDTLQQCGFNSSLPLVMIIHGWSVGNADMPFFSLLLRFLFFSPSCVQF